MYSKKYLSWLHEIDDDSKDSVGRKAQRLSELANAGFSIPKGFVIKSQLLTQIASDCFLEQKIHHQLGSIDPYNREDIQLASKRIQRLVEGIQLPKNIVLDIYSMYERIGANAYVSVRGSVSEGPFSISHNPPFLSVCGDVNLLIYIRKMWASYFSPHTIENLLKQPKLHFGFSIIVEEMIDSQVSGVMFTSSPDGIPKDALFINATYGIRDEYIAKYPYPDLYQVTKSTHSIVSIESISQRKALKRIGSEIVEVSIDVANQNRQKLASEHILKLAQWGKSIQTLYYFPQKVEWAFSNGSLYIVDTQPLSNQEKVEHPQTEIAFSGIHLETLIRSLPESQGIATGPLKVVNSENAAHKVMIGDIVIIPNSTMLNFIPLKKVGGVIVENSNSFDQKILFLKGSGVPFILGHLKTPYEGIVTLDATNGTLYKGSLPTKLFVEESNKNDFHETKKTITATKLYLDSSNLADMEIADDFIDGFGLVKSEFIERLYGDSHLKKLDYICKIANDKPILYRLYKKPSLGALNFMMHPHILKAELERITQSLKITSNCEIALVIPFLRTVDELRFIEKQLAEHQIEHGIPFKVWIMIETPSAVLDLDNLLSEKIDGIVIGLNDLTASIFAIDRNNPEFKTMYTQMHRLVEKTVLKILKKANEYGKPVIVAGEALADSFDVLRYCIKGGVKGVCVSKEAVHRIKEQISVIEKEIVKK